MQRIVLKACAFEPPEGYGSAWKEDLQRLKLAEEREEQRLKTGMKPDLMQQIMIKKSPEMERSMTEELKVRKKRHQLIGFTTGITLLTVAIGIWFFGHGLHFCHRHQTQLLCL